MGDPNAEGFILCTVERAGDIAIWWRPGGCGYTTSLSEAGVYTRGEAEGMTSRDVFVPRADAESEVRRVVLIEGPVAEAFNSRSQITEVSDG